MILFEKRRKMVTLTQFKLLIIRVMYEMLIFPFGLIFLASVAGNIWMPEIREKMIGLSIITGLILILCFFMIRRAKQVIKLLQ